MLIAVRCLCGRGLNAVCWCKGRLLCRLARHSTAHWRWGVPTRPWHDTVGGAIFARPAGVLKAGFWLLLVPCGLLPCREVITWSSRFATQNLPQQAAKR